MSLSLEELRELESILSRSVELSEAIARLSLSPEMVMRRANQESRQLAAIRELIAIKEERQARSLSVERLKELYADIEPEENAAAGLVICSAKAGEFAEALRELIAIKEAEPVFYAYQQADGGEMFWHSARDLATAEIRSDGAVYPLIRKPE